LADYLTCWLGDFRNFLKFIITDSALDGEITFCFKDLVPIIAETMKYLSALSWRNIYCTSKYLNISTMRTDYN